MVTAQLDDIYYEWNPSPQRVRQERLSDHVGSQQAAALVRKILGPCGLRSGRIYVNEARVVLRPDTEGYGGFMFLARLEDGDPWFPPGSPWDDHGA